MARCIGYRGSQVLQIVTIATDDGQQSPSYAMIANALGFNSVADVCNVVRRLEKRGLLARCDTGARHDRGWHEPVIVCRFPLDA